MGSGVTGSQGSPRRTLVARATKSTPSVLETKGKDRDTRTLHSITFKLFSLAIIWRFRGPDTWRACATERHTFLTLLRVSVFMSWNRDGDLTYSISFHARIGYAKFCQIN